MFIIPMAADPADILPMQYPLMEQDLEMLTDSFNKEYCQNVNQVLKIHFAYENFTASVSVPYGELTGTNI